MATVHHEIAEKIFFGGNIFTLEESQPTVEALAVSNGRITALGSLSDVMQYSGKGTEIVYLNQHSLFPGFIEAHQHPLIRIFTSSMCTDVGGLYYHTADEVKQRIKTEIDRMLPRANEVPIPWCIFCGWDPELVPNLPKLNIDFIEAEFSSLIPVIIVAQNLHSSWANHKVFEVSGIATDSDDFPKDSEGKLTGQIMKATTILNVVSFAPASSKAELHKTLHQVFSDYSSRGFTTITELAYTPETDLDPLLIDYFSQENCPVRLALYQKMNVTPENEELFQLHSPNPEKLWMAGIKLWADGSPHTGTIAVREPLLKTAMAEEFLSFPPSPNYGILSFSTELLSAKVAHYHKKGAQIAIHAQGDRAVEQVLSIYESVIPEKSDRIRHRIEHLGLATDHQLETCARLGLAPSFFVDQLQLYATSFCENILGPERTNRWTCLASAIKFGCTISIHQDNPAFPGPPLPLLNIKTAVTRTQRDNDDVVYGEDQRISVHEAIKAYTVGPAWQLFREDEIGSLKVGKFADFVILSDNPYLVSPEKLGDIKVAETYTAGACNNHSKKRELKLPTLTVLEPRKDS